MPEWFKVYLNSLPADKRFQLYEWFDEVRPDFSIVCDVQDELNLDGVCLGPQPDTEQKKGEWNELSIPNVYAQVLDSLPKEVKREVSDWLNEVDDHVIYTDMQTVIDPDYI